MTALDYATRCLSADSPALLKRTSTVSAAQMAEGASQMTVDQQMDAFAKEEIVFEPIEGANGWG